MGCHASADRLHTGLKRRPRPLVPAGDKGEASEDSAPVIFKTEIEEWWCAASHQLRESIMCKDFEDDAKWADSFLAFVTRGLAACRWEHVDSPRVQSIVTQEEYVKEYAACLAGRSDVTADNLYRIKLDADRFLEVCLQEAAGERTLASMLGAFLARKEVFIWSQGSFGPQVYASSFLQAYANSMVSDSLFTQAKDHFARTYHGTHRQLECGVFYIEPGVSYPLHYHKELEAYYILGGSTRFVWLLDGELVYMDRKQGEWQFNPPNIPHAITTPHGTPHLSLWFREGGPGQKANNKFGPKWIGDVDGLHMRSEDDTDHTHDSIVTEGEDDAAGGLGFAVGGVVREDCNKFVRKLTPAQFEDLRSINTVVDHVDAYLTPQKKVLLDVTLESLHFLSKLHARRKQT